MSKHWTVVSCCQCGCGDSAVDHVRAKDADEAAKKVGLKREETEVIAVFFGHLKDRYHHEDKH